MSDKFTNPIRDPDVAIVWEPPTLAFLLGAVRNRFEDQKSDDESRVD